MLIAIVVVVAIAGCSDDVDAEAFEQRGIQFEVPRGWSVTGFSETVSPPRLVAASFPVRDGDVEGDCGGIDAVQRLPAGGAYIVLIDYGAGSAGLRDFRDTLPVETLATGQLAEFECFGRSFAFRFTSGSHALQAHVGLGDAATRATRSEALALLNSIRASA